jgi:hypothetical protein
MSALLIKAKEVGPEAVGEEEAVVAGDEILRDAI